MSLLLIPLLLIAVLGSVRVVLFVAAVLYACDDNEHKYTFDDHEDEP
jgi:hypothetical protein